jgi:hypothetical protein
MIGDVGLDSRRPLRPGDPESSRREDLAGQCIHPTIEWGDTREEGHHDVGSAAQSLPDGHIRWQIDLQAGRRMDEHED